MAEPIRILTAVPICDGHDSAILSINLEFVRHGIDVIYLGYNGRREISRAPPSRRKHARWASRVTTEGTSHDRSVRLGDSAQESILHARRW